MAEKADYTQHAELTEEPWEALRRFFAWRDVTGLLWRNLGQLEAETYIFSVFNIGYGIELAGT